MLPEQVADFLAELDRESLSLRDVPSRLRRHAWLGDISSEHRERLLSELLAREAPPPGSAAEALLAGALSLLAASQAPRRAASRSLFSAAACGLVAQLYRHLGAASRARHELLALLAATYNGDALRTLAELAASDPPQIAERFLTPLFQHRDYDPAPLFPRLLDAIEHLALAVPVLDLTNFLTREGRVSGHPASDRSERLAALLTELTHELQQIAETPPPLPESPETRRRVNEGVALAVALCDALALIGDRTHLGKLRQALEIPHRRVRTEAAYALAKLGESEGQEALVALAAEPVARLRALAYAEELGLTDRIDERLRTAEAKAEAELVVWLSEANQMGIPPGTCELIDRRVQYWPGFDEPLACFLFHFSYRLGDAAYSNVGIVGPLTHAFAADLTDLPPDDIYAAFAGWQAEHEDIFEIPAARLPPAQQAELERLQRRLHEAGYAAIEPVKLGFFFGERVLIARAQREGVAGCAIVDSQACDWRPTVRPRRPPGPDELYCIYKGRKLLKAFNP